MKSPNPASCRTASGALVVAALLTGLTASVHADDGNRGQECRHIPHTVPQYADWPRVDSEIRKDPALETRIANIVAGMSLREKIGQMTQPEIQSITPDEVRQYYIGSVLNGGGSWPGQNKHAPLADWLKLADAYWQASLSTDSTVKVPVIWGIDAVHGNNNVYGATLFPHNIGLGAAHDPCLIRRIGEATAQQVRVTGQDWAFAPTLAVVRDDRWGRAYEGYSEHPTITRAYADEMIEGLQGTDTPGWWGLSHRRGPQKLQGLIATAKHFIGDGGTDQGRDQGVTMSSEEQLRNLHGQGYFSALRAGAQSVMITFNSWTNEELGIREGKIHGSKYLINDVLKGKMGFDGLIVSDWNGHGQVTGCSSFRCAQAINAGIDVFMVPNDWKAFIENTLQLVESGEVPMSRIDDAVTRILRVKFRAGLFDAPKPSARHFAGDMSHLVHRPLAREAVRKSLVLLKNNNHVLPLRRNQKVLVVGKNADSLANQNGGWTLSWQGTGNVNADFPNGDTILAGIRQAAGDTNVTFSETADGVNVTDYGAVIAVIGETPYAEGFGDIGRTRTMEHARLHPRDIAVLDKVAGHGVPVVTVFVAGRPLYTNKEINRSDAFVAAWLPGTEGAGVADVLFRDARGRANYDFSGKLSYSWPNAACQSPLNTGDSSYEPLFAFGYGLDYRHGRRHVGTLDETSLALGCGDTGGGGNATDPLDIYVRQAIPPFRLYIGSPDNWGGTEVPDDLNAVVAHTNLKIETTDVNTQGDGKLVTWHGSGAGQVYAQQQGSQDLRGYLNVNGALVFDAIVRQRPAAFVKMRVDCIYPCVGEVDATRLYRDILPLNVKTTVKIPLQCFYNNGTDFALTNTPMLIFTENAFALAFANLRWVPQAANDADALQCDQLLPE